MQSARPSAGALERAPRVRVPLSALLALLSLMLAAPSFADLPATAGRWTVPSRSLDYDLAQSGTAYTAIHAALLRGEDDWQTNSAHYHSYLLWWENRHALCGDTRPFNGSLYGWRPAPDTLCSYDMMHSGFTRLNIANSELDPGFDLFCAGHSIIDGKLFVVGGASAENSGTSFTTIFDPHASGVRWARQDPMHLPRWYPTLTQLSNNDVVVYAGLQYARLHVVHGLTPGSTTPHAEVGRHQLTAGGEWDADLLPEEDEQYVGSGRPSARAYASAPVREFSTGITRATLFGGKDASTGESQYPADVWWLVHNTDSGSDTLRWWKFTDYKGTAPPGLWKHSTVLEADTDTLWVYGGRIETGELSPRIYRGRQVHPDPALDSVGVAWSRSWKWDRWQPSELPNGPGPRYGAGAAYDGKYNRMIVYGGYSDAAGTVADNDVYALTLGPSPSWQKLTWSSHASGERPGRLAEAGMTAEPSEAEHLSGSTTEAASVYLYGGVDESGTLHGDAWLMYFPSSSEVSWVKLPAASGAKPRPRKGAVVVRDKDSWDLRIFGGESATSADDDTVWTIDVFRTTYSGCNDAPRPWLPHGRHPGGNLIGAAGYADPHELAATTMEKATPVSSGMASWTAISGSSRYEVFYPPLFALPTNKILDAYAREFDRHTNACTLSGVAAAWPQFPAGSTTSGLSGLGGGSAVMRILENGTVDILKCGSKDTDASNHFAVRTTGRLQLGAHDETSGWSVTDSMAARVYHNLVTLPSGRVLVTGGLDFGDMGAGPATTHAVKRPQIWDPATGHWTHPDTLAEEPLVRGYHSTALLLPDGRVLTGGGNDPTGESSHKSQFAVYCPPNLFNSGGGYAAAPVLYQAPTRVKYGTTTFKVKVSPPGYATRVVLIRPGAVTHGFNSSQRYIELPFDRCDEGLVVTAPDSLKAPPGDYLLFVVQGEAPSLGHWLAMGTTATQGEPTWEACHAGGSGGGGGGGGGSHEDPIVYRPGASSFSVTGELATAPEYEDNTLFPGVADGELASDRLRLPNGPRTDGDHLRVRLRHLGAGRDEYARVRLVALDHATAESADADTSGERNGTAQPAISLVDESGGDRLMELATDAGAGIGVGAALQVDLGGAGDGSGVMWIESSGQAPEEGGVRIEVLEGAIWREVAIHTPREHRSRALVPGVTGRQVRLVFLGAHHLHGLGWFNAGTPSVTRTELQAIEVRHSREGTLSGDAVFALSSRDTAWVEFPLLADASNASRSWFLEVEGRPVGYQPSAERLGARHAPPSEVPVPPVTLAVMRFLGGAPNPASGATRFMFELPAPGEVRLEIFDTQGRRVRRFVLRFAAGPQVLEWDRTGEGGVRVAPGIYQARLIAAGRRETKPIVLLP